jgi:hypothetical protein
LYFSVPKFKFFFPLGFDPAKVTQFSLFPHEISLTNFFILIFFSFLLFVDTFPKPCFKEGKLNFSKKIVRSCKVRLSLPGESLQGLGRGDAEFVGEIEVFQPISLLFVFSVCMIFMKLYL